MEIVTIASLGGVETLVEQPVIIGARANLDLLL